MAEPRTGRGLRVATLAAAVLAAAAVVLAAWQGVSWMITANGSEQVTAGTRDEVLREARTLVVNLESVDYRAVEDGLDRREAAATGPLLAQFQSTRARYADQVRQTQAITTAVVLDAAVTEADTTAGAATVLIFVDLTTTQHRDGKQTGQTQDRQRLELQLARTDDGWKAAQADPVGARS